MVNNVFRDRNGNVYYKRKGLKKGYGGERVVKSTGSIRKDIRQYRIRLRRKRIW